MAFSIQAAHVIRAYQAVEGRLPTQAELDALTERTSLVSVINGLDLGLGDTTREQFVRNLYENSGIEDDDEGVAYWVGMLRGDETGTMLTRAQLVEAFQYLAAKDHPNSTLAQATTTAAAEGLTGENLQFRDPTQQEDDGDDETAPDFDGTVKFNTSVEDRDGAAQNEYTGAFNQRLAESGDHSIFNIGLNELVGNGREMANSTTTADYTFEVHNQLGAEGIYQGLFLSPVIAPTVTTDASEGTLRLRVADRLARADDVDNTLDSVSVPFFSMLLNGESIRIESDEMAAARTYEELEAAISNEFARLQEAGLLDESFAVRLDREFREDRYVRQENGTRVQEGEVVGKEIVITTNAGVLEEGNILVISAGERGIDPVAYGLEDFVEGDSSAVIETNLNLNNVGYGSQGGSINITGQSNSNKGIEKFNIEASNGVWLTTLMSANGHQTGGVDDAGNQHLRQVELTGQGYFNVGEQDGSSVRQSDDAGLHNVTHFNASGFDGSVRLDATLGEAVNGSSVNYNLGGSNNQLFMDASKAEDLNINIRTGGGNDIIGVDLGNETGSVNYDGSGLNITTSGGSNIVNVSGGASYTTMAKLQNLQINTGGGADRISVDGRGTFDIDAGIGNDVIFINAYGSASSWTFGNAVSSHANTEFETRVLYEAKLEVNFAGFEKEITVPTRAQDNFVADQKVINQAIKDAIEGDRVLNELLTVTLSHNGQVLTVTQNYDGANNLDIKLTQPTLVEGTPDEDLGEVRVNTAHTDALKAGLIQTGVATDSNDVLDLAAVITNISGLDSDVTIAEDETFGSNGSIENFSSIDAGRGQDIVILSSHEDSANQIVFSGQFDNLTVVNFFQDEGQLTTGVGNHGLDFSDLLTTQQSASESILSRKLVEITFEDRNSTADMTANQVRVARFEADPDADTASFASFTGNQLVTLLNDADGDSELTLGGLGYIEVEAQADLVGNTQKHVMLIENSKNLGEYRVFELTSTVDSDGNATFTNANSLGTVDFGDSINDGISAANLVGTTEWAQAYENAIAAADGRDPEEIGGGDDVVVPEDAVFTATGDITVEVDEPAEAHVMEIDLGVQNFTVTTEEDYTLTVGDVTLTASATESMTPAQLIAVLTTGDNEAAYGDADFTIAEGTVNTADNHAIVITWKEAGEVTPSTVALTSAIDFADDGAEGVQVTEGQDETYSATAVTIDLAATDTWDPEAPAELEAGYIFKLTVGDDVIAEYTVEAGDTLVEVAAGLVAFDTSATNYTVEAVTDEASQVEVNVADASLLDSDANITITLTGMSATDWATL